MGYQKQLIVLKETAEGFSVNGKSLSGIVRAETENGVSFIYLSLINFASVKEGEFFLSILDDEGVLSFPLGKSPFSAAYQCKRPLKTDGGVAAGIFFVNKDVVAVAFDTVNKSVSLPLFKEKVYENLKEPVKKEEYDDELIATENYFDKESFNARPKEPYYLKVKKDLDDLFTKYPKEEKLEKAVQGSSWVKIFYNEEKYYTVGLVREGGKPKYICYGIPAKYSVAPPKELDGFCSFLPLSLFDLKGDGYWMIYQDAETGDCVKLNG